MGLETCQILGQVPLSLVTRRGGGAPEEQGRRTQEQVVEEVISTVDEELFGRATARVDVHTEGAVACL